MKAPCWLEGPKRAYRAMRPAQKKVSPEYAREYRRRQKLKWMALGIIPGGVPTSYQPGPQTVQTSLQYSPALRMWVPEKIKASARRSGTYGGCALHRGKA